MYKKAPKGLFSYILMGASFILAAFTDINVIFIIIGCGLAGLFNSLVLKRRAEK
jgi:chromate transporter